MAAIRIDSRMVCTMYYAVCTILFRTVLQRQDYLVVAVRNPDSTSKMRREEDNIIARSYGLDCLSIDLSNDEILI